MFLPITESIAEDTKWSPAIYSIGKKHQTAITKSTTSLGIQFGMHFVEI